MVVEVVGAVVTGSLALLSDAGHMLTDVIGIGMALAAIHLAERGSRRSHRTFGLYRLEILAALANAVLLLGVAVYVLIEAVRRFADPADVLSGWMLAVAVAGLVANLVAFALLREGAAESLNVEGAYLEVLADTVGSVGVILAAVVLRRPAGRGSTPSSPSPSGCGSCRGQSVSPAGRSASSSRPRHRAPTSTRCVPTSPRSTVSSTSTTSTCGR